MGGNTLGIITEFRRRLALRLSLAAVLLACLAGAAVYLFETERLESKLLDQATFEARALGDVARGMHPEGEHNPELSAFIAERSKSRRDFFVLVELYDPARKAVAAATAPRYEEIEKAFDQSRHEFPKEGDFWYQWMSVAGQSYLQVMVPLPKNGVGWFEGVYRVSEQTLTDIRTSILVYTLLTVLVVLGTAAVLYPLMLNLQGHVVDTAKALLQGNLDTLKVLGNAIAKRDSDTHVHNYRVTVYAIRIAETLGLRSEDIRSLIKGAFLHDVGKIAIPDQILLKPGKLTEDEFAKMKEHVDSGLDIISSSEWLADAAQVVGGHHEKVDGSGYPLGLSGDAIPLAARIFAVADVFDALTSTRPYKKAMPLEEALAIMEEGCGQHFDKTVYRAFHTISGPVFAQVSQLGDEQVETLADISIRRYFPLT